MAIKSKPICIQKSARPEDISLHQPQKVHLNSALMQAPLGPIELFAPAAEKNLRENATWFALRTKLGSSITCNFRFSHFTTTTRPYLLLTTIKKEVVLPLLEQYSIHWNCWIN